MDITQQTPSKRRGKRRGVTLHKASGQFRKCIGKYVAKDGTIKPKIWYLGTDREIAEVQALKTRLRWKQLRQEGKELWDSSEVKASAKPKTVHEARECYLKELSDRVDKQLLTQSHLDSQSYRLARAIEHLDRLPLEALGVQEIKNAVNTIAARPASNAPRTDGKKDISALYARSVIRTLSSFCTWMHEHGYWTRPDALPSAFRVDVKRNPLDGIDAANRKPVTFEIEDLKKLYAAANSRQKLWICLGLNCGFSTAEIASLRWNEIVGLDQNAVDATATTDVFIRRHRTKTQIYSEWKLFPQTIALLKEQKKPGQDGDLVFLSQKGDSLAQANALGQSWKRLLKRAKVSRPLTFKFLRKTGAWMVRQRAGTEVAEMYLAHSEKGMIKHYADRHWQLLHRALDALHQELALMLGNEQLSMEDNQPNQPSASANGVTDADFLRRIPSPV